MEGKIDKDGVLWIDRKGTMKKQNCPKYEFGVCCDECPFFEEPTPELEFMPYSEGVLTGRMQIKLCEKTLTFFKLTDERGKV